MRIATASAVSIAACRGALPVASTAVFRLPQVQTARPPLSLAATARVVPRRHERRQAAIGAGRGLLDALDQLRAALLGEGAGAALAALAGRLDDGPATSGDPALDELIEQIKLRADVEIAKARQRSGQDQLQPRNQQHEAERPQHASV